MTVNFPCALWLCLVRFSLLVGVYSAIGDSACPFQTTYKYVFAPNFETHHSSQRPKDDGERFRPDQNADESGPATALCLSKSPGGNVYTDSLPEDRPGSFPWLYGNANRYMECLDEFQRFSDEWQGVQRWIGHNFAKLVDLQDLGHGNEGYIATRIQCGQPPIPTKGVYRMLGVGSGSGEVDAAILRVLLPRHPHVSTTVVEPDLSQINLYRQLMAENHLPGVHFEYHQQTSLEFIMENSHNMTFDLIHMVHVLYHIDLAELEMTFLHYYRSLSPGGVMFITYESDKSSIARIREALQPFQPGMLPYMSVKNIEIELCKVVPTYERDDIKGTLDVTACLGHDPSANGDCLWDFITRVVDFRANAPQEVVQYATDMLQRLSWRDDSGRILTNTDTAVFVVTKYNPHTL